MTLAPSPAAVREAVHLLILEALSGIRGGDVVTLKGGVNLRLFFQSVRYSEDIDLDGTVAAAPAIRGCITGLFKDRDLLRRLQRIGIRDLDPGQGPNKNTATTFRYKFGVIGRGGIRYPTKVEVSFRGRHPGDAILRETPGAPLARRYGFELVPVQHYARMAAVRQKIRALGERREVQARDVFDLHVLGAAAPDEALLNFLAAEVGERCLEESSRRALELSYPEYQGQVLEFLEEDVQSKYASEATWDAIRLDVAELIERVARRKEGK